MPPISEADVHAHHLSRARTHARAHPLPRKAKKPRRPPPFAAQSPPKLISASSILPLPLPLPISSISPCPDKRARNAIPTKNNLASSTAEESDEEYDQLLSSSIIGTQERVRDASSDTLASSTIPSSPVLLRPSKTRPVVTLEMMGFGKAGETVLRTPIMSVKTGEGKVGAKDKGSRRKKGRKGPGWVTCTPSRA